MNYKICIMQYYETDIDYPFGSNYELLDLSIGSSLDFCKVRKFIPQTQNCLYLVEKLLSNCGIRSKSHNTIFDILKF